MDPIFMMPIVASLFWAVVVGLLAKRKNRNPIGWGISGALLMIIALIILAFMPYLCPKCHHNILKKHLKTGSCPNCQDTKGAEVLTAR